MMRMEKSKFPPGAAEDILTLYEDIIDFLVEHEDPPIDNYEVYIVTRQTPLEIDEVFRMFKIYAIKSIVPTETNVAICGDMILIKRAYDNGDCYSNEIQIILLKRGVQFYVYFDTRKEEDETEVTPASSPVDNSATELLYLLKEYNDLEHELLTQFMEWKKGKHNFSYDKFKEREEVFPLVERQRVVRDKLGIEVERDIEGHDITPWLCHMARRIIKHYIPEIREAGQE